MRKNQKGYTIVELLIAVAILSIVVASVCGFILVGSRSYAAGNSDIGVQQEAQLALNQMSDLLIDTTRSVNYAGYDAGGNPVSALKDSEFTFTPKDKSLVMYNGVVEGNPADVSTQTVNSGNGNKHYHFYWSKDKETLYYAELDVQSTDVNTSAIHFPAFDTADPAFDPVAGGWVVLASHVTDFSADLSQLEEKRVVQLALTFVDGTKEYVTSNNVTIRNKVGVNDAELDPVNKKKTLSVAPRDSGVIIEPGETYHFSTPRVTGENVADRSVTWSLTSSGSPSGQTRFTDTANGILYVAEDEPAGTIDAVITTNAVDSDGQHASCPVSINIKRIKEFTLTVKDPEGTETNDKGETVYLVSPGREYTITVADFKGNKLGEVCSVCGDDTDMDRSVGYVGNPYGNPYVWRLVDPKESDPSMSWWHPEQYLTLGDSDGQSLKVSLASDTPAGGDHVFVIQAMSILSTQNKVDGRHYDNWVPGAITLKAVKSKEGEAKPISGGLSYGTDNEENVHNEMKTGVLEKEIRPGTGKYVPESSFVTCVHAVDNSGEDPVKTILHFTIGGGADFRIAPDLFDLDLEKSYTFYIQALCPVSKDNLLYGDDHLADSEETIWKEYWDNSNHEAPFDYYGDRYVYGDVYYGRLGKPTAIWNYKGNTYEGTDLVLDPVNVYMVGPGGTLIGAIEPSDYRNIWHLNRTQKKMTYSVYVEGEGGSWEPVYVFNSDDGVMCYQGNKEIGGGVGVLMLGDGPGQPTNPSCFMKMENGDKQKVCGNYRIVPGFCYDNTFDRGTADYRIIGWDGFSDCSYAPGKEFVLPHKLKYYQFDESVIYAKLTSEFTMDINDDWFQGQVNFPLPKDMIKSPALFPIPYDTEWKNTAGSLRVEALQAGSSNGEYKTFAYVSYRYISKNDSWEVEPFEVKFDTNAKKIYTHSYGTYVCDKNGSKWEKIWTNPGSTTEKDMVCNVKPFSINNGNDYQAFFPLPTDAGFPFVGGVNEIASYELEYFDNNMQSQGKLSGLTVTCKQNGDEYEIEFLKETKERNDKNYHKITVVSYGTYTCRKGQTEWTRKKGYSVTYKTDLMTNLEGMTVADGTVCKMYFPVPTDNDFPFKGNVTEIQCTDTHVVYDVVTDVYCENPKYLNWWGTSVKHTFRDNTNWITFTSSWGQEFGTFKWNGGEGKWEKVN